MGSPRNVLAFDKLNPAIEPTVAAQAFWDQEFRSECERLRSLNHSVQEISKLAADWATAATKQRSGVVVLSPEEHLMETEARHDRERNIAELYTLAKERRHQLEQTEGQLADVNDELASLRTTAERDRAFIANLPIRAGTSTEESGSAVLLRGKLKKKRPTLADMHPAIHGAGSRWLAVIAILKLVGFDTSEITGSEFWDQEEGILDPHRVDPLDSDKRRALRKFYSRPLR